MRLATFYIGKIVVLATLLTALILVGLDVFFSLANELRYVGTGQYTLLNAFIYLGIGIPRRLYTMFPMAAMLGSLMGLGLLAAHSELIALRAAGISMQQIALAVMKTAFILVVIVTAAGEGIAPYLEALSQSQRAILLSNGQAVQTTRGTWLRDGQQFIHIRNFTDPLAVEGITRYVFDDALKLVKTSFAAKGRYETGHWVLNDVRETLFEPSRLRTRIISEVQWESKINPEVIHVVGMDHLDRLAIWDLLDVIHYREANGLYTDSYRLALWDKIIQPFETLLMMLLAIPFIFGPLRSSTLGMKMLVGVLLGFSFYTLNSVFGPIALVYRLPPFLGAILPSVLFSGLAIFLFRKTPA